jgi:AcrR family transcriptional regulator
MANVDQTRERILNGAMEALAIHGTRRFSVSEASHRSGVSRGTFYRYFPTKDALLNALTAHLGGGFYRYLHERITPSVGADKRAELVAKAVREYVDETPVLTQLLLAEPSFVQNFYTSVFCDLLRVVATNIEPRFASLAMSAQHELMTVAEVMVRLAISYRVVQPGQCGLPEDRLLEKQVELAKLAQAPPDIGTRPRRKRAVSVR